MEYPDDYDLDTSDAYIVEDGSTIAGFLLLFVAIFVVGSVLKLIGYM